MLITTLIITACLQDSAGKITKECKDFNVNIFDERITVPRCQSEAMITFPQWVEEHPGWLIKAWKCIQTETKDKDSKEQDI